MKPSSVALLAAAVVVVAGLIALRLQAHGPTISGARSEAAAGCRDVDTAFADRTSGRWLALSATVVRLLPDSYGRYEHQRFVVRCSDGHTILIVNDISVGERAPVRVGDLVGVRGQYIWNQQGGLLHFTHRGSGDASGWILLGNRLYSLGHMETSAGMT